MSDDGTQWGQPLRAAGRFIGRESASAVVGWVVVATVVASALWTWQRGWSVLIYAGLFFLGVATAAVVCLRRCRSLEDRLGYERDRATRIAGDLQLVTGNLEIAREQLAVSIASAETLVAIVQLDASLLNALSVMVAARDRDAAIRNILYEFLRDCSGILGPDLNRAYVLRPTLDGFLRPFVAYQMPAETLTRTEFRILADDGRARGIAGEAYVSRQLVVVHMEGLDGRWKADHSSYIVFEPSRPHPPYLSFATVPIMASDESPCLGVLCLDSMNPTLFDPPETRDLLLTLGLRIAHTIMLHDALDEEGSKS